MVRQSPYHNWDIPNVGGDEDKWGDYLNNTLSDGAPQDEFERSLDNEVVKKGTFNDRPAASVAGRWYLATGEKSLYLDNGDGWETIIGQQMKGSPLEGLGHVHTTDFVDLQAPGAPGIFDAPDSDAPLRIRADEGGEGISLQAEDDSNTDGRDSANITWWSTAGNSVGTIVAHRNPNGAHFSLYTSDGPPDNTGTSLQKRLNVSADEDPARVLWRHISLHQVNHSGTGSEAVYRAKGASGVPSKFSAFAENGHNQEDTWYGWDDANGRGVISVRQADALRFETDQSVSVPNGPLTATDLRYGTTFGSTAWVSGTSPKLATTEDMEIYVDPTGSDSGAGTSSDPVATIQEALSRVPKHIYHQVRIYIRDGDYTAEGNLQIANHYIQNGSAAQFKIIGHHPDHPDYTDLAPSNVLIGKVDETATTGANGSGWYGVQFNEWYQSRCGILQIEDCIFNSGSDPAGTGTTRAFAGYYQQNLIKNCTFDSVDVAINATQNAQMAVTQCDVATDSNGNPTVTTPAEIKQNSRVGVKGDFFDQCGGNPTTDQSSTFEGWNGITVADDGSTTVEAGMDLYGNFHFHNGDIIEGLNDTVLYDVSAGKLKMQQGGIEMFTHDITDIGNAVLDPSSSGLSDGGSINSGTTTLRGYYDSDGTTTVSAASADATLQHIVNGDGSSALGLDVQGTRAITAESSGRVVTPNGRLHASAGAQVPDDTQLLFGSGDDWGMDYDSLNDRLYTRYHPNGSSPQDVIRIQGSGSDIDFVWNVRFFGNVHNRSEFHQNDDNALVFGSSHHHYMLFDSANSRYVWEDRSGTTTQEVMELPNGGTLNLPNGLQSEAEQLFDPTSDGLADGGTIDSPAVRMRGYYDSDGSTTVSASSVDARIYHQVYGSGASDIVLATQGVANFYLGSNGDVSAPNASSFQVGGNEVLTTADQDVAASGTVTLSSGSATISTGITSSDTDIDVALDPSGGGNNSVQVGVAARVIWRGDLSTPEYEVEILEDGTSVGNPDVGYKVMVN